MKNQKIAYTLTREKTRQQTGFLVAVPDENLTTESALSLLTSRPMDDFLHQHLLRCIARMAPEVSRQFLSRGRSADNPVYQALEAEYLLLLKGRKHLKKRFSLNTIRELSHHTPLIYLRSFIEPDQSLHCRWTAFFRENLQQHKILLPPDQNDLPPLSFKPSPFKPKITLADLADSDSIDRISKRAEISPDRTAAIAADRLSKAGIELGQLMRHESSLSPIGLLRTWRFVTHTDNHRNRFSLSGEQTSYGRGLSPDAAQASLMMEIVERCSAFASVSAGGLENYQNDYPLRLSSFSELVRETTENNGSDASDVLDPSTLALETAYRDQSLYWVCGETPNRHNARNSNRPVWIPAQCLFLFCNLDEPALFSGLGSTGLAAGNTMAQAKTAALLEIIERHQASTVPYHPSTCFRLLVRETRIAGLLDAYRQAGIDLWFQDITPAIGVPCCRCFVVEQNGHIHTGTAAHLDARQAIVSAITETACPFPNPPATRPAPSALSLVNYEDLPDYSTGASDTDLTLLETLLLQNNFRPCHVDLTRSDIGLPVVRTVVPGMEILGDFDNYSRVHPDLYQNYLALH